MMLNNFVDLQNSFYVGDAAGRGENWKEGIAADFSDTDRKFALNIGVNFYTPEEYFLHERKAGFTISYYDFTNLNTGIANSNVFGSRKLEIIIFVGPPSVGKTTFFKKVLEKYNYLHISLVNLIVIFSGFFKTKNSSDFRF